MSAESGKILIWNRLTEQGLFKAERAGVRQITLLDGGQRFLAISRPADSGADVTRINATIVTRTIPGKLLQSLYHIHRVRAVQVLQLMLRKGQNIG